TTELIRDEALRQVGDLLLAGGAAHELLKRHERLGIVVLDLEEDAVDPRADPTSGRRVEDDRDRDGEDLDERGVAWKVDHEALAGKHADEEVGAGQNRGQGPIDQASTDDDVDVQKPVAHDGEGERDGDRQLEETVQLGRQGGLEPGQPWKGSEENVGSDADRKSPQQPLGLLPLPGKLELPAGAVQGQTTETHDRDEEHLGPETWKRGPLPQRRPRVREVPEQCDRLPRKEDRGGDPEAAHHPRVPVENFSPPREGQRHAKEKGGQQRETRDPDERQNRFGPRQRSRKIETPDHDRDAVEERAPVEVAHGSAIDAGTEDKEVDGQE